MAVCSPSELKDALDILNAPDCVLISGGTDYFPALKRGGSERTLLNLMKVREMRGISLERSGVRFGAALTWSEIIRADLPPAFDALKSAGKEVGSIQIQNAATLAGNLCNASPAADGVPALLALDAQVELQSAARGARQIPLTEFLKGVRKIDRRPDEILTSIFVPQPPECMRSIFSKLGSRTYLVISICMTALNVVLDKEGRVRELRVAVGACSPVAQRLSLLEAEAIGQNLREIKVRDDHISPLKPIDDVRASAEYRLEAAKEQIQRALHELSR
jgi:CO/xanthine dehydrogenase FAD-binding subunit